MQFFLGTCLIAEKITEISQNQQNRQIKKAKNKSMHILIGFGGKLADPSMRKLKVDDSISILRCKQTLTRVRKQITAYKNYTYDYHFWIIRIITINYAGQSRSIIIL